MKTLVVVSLSILGLLTLRASGVAQYGSAKYPRPTFSGPAHIPFESAKLAFWGESDATGYASDWIYVSNDKIHQLMFQMPPGAFYRSSERLKVVNASDELWYVLGGSLMLNNPETGEVHRINKGEAAFFRRDIWHHGFSYGIDPVRVIEFFAPPPAAEGPVRYRESKPFLKEFKERQDHWLGRWPAAKPEAQGKFTMRVLRDSDILWRLEGQSRVGVLVSTEHITAGEIVLLPGQKSDLHVHGGDESLYLVEGHLNVNTPRSVGQQSFILKPEDGFYVPEGTPHQLVNMSDRPAKVLFGVAPNYLPRSE
jgi:quercetin dioxygenase-like cupin family protein